MNRISNRDLEHHESIIALANAIQRRSEILQTTTNDSEILRALREIQQFSIGIKSRQQQQLKEHRNDS